MGGKQNLTEELMLAESCGQQLSTTNWKGGFNNSACQTLYNGNNVLKSVFPRNYMKLKDIRGTGTELW